jgi:hypothetical protein
LSAFHTFLNAMVYPNSHAHAYTLRQPGEHSIVLQVSASGLHLPDGNVVPWRDLRTVNLCWVPASRYNVAHFLCRIYTADRSVFVRADCDNMAEAGTYSDFVRDLHGRLSAAGAKPQYTMGMRGRLGYILLLSSFAAAFVLLEGLVAYAITQRGKLGMGIGFMAMIALVGTLFLRMAVRVLKPRHYDPADIPAHLLQP